MLKKTYIKFRKIWNVVFELPVPECPQGIDIQTISLTGDFNNWEHGTNPMKLHEGTYTTTLDLEPGHEYQFRYLINDGVWCNDWNADGYIRNVFGEDNCVIKLPHPDFKE
jgi:Glycogen recognition site of AMP-activated protein kinase